jgi:hypothetical protein
MFCMTRMRVFPGGSVAVPERYAHCGTAAPLAGAAMAPAARTGTGVPAGARVGPGGAGTAFDRLVDGTGAVLAVGGRPGEPLGAVGPTEAVGDDADEGDLSVPVPGTAPGPPTPVGLERAASVASPP